MLSREVKIMEVELNESEKAILRSARNIIDELTDLIAEIDTEDGKLLCDCGYEDEQFTVNEMEDIGRYISIICDAYRIES